MRRAGHHVQQTRHQPGMVVSPTARGELSRENGILIFSCLKVEFGGRLEN